MQDPQDPQDPQDLALGAVYAHHWDLVLRGTKWIIMFSRKEGVVVEGDVNDDELFDTAAMCGLSVLAVHMIQAVVLQMKKEK